MGKQLELAIRWHFEGCSYLLQGNKQMATIAFAASQAAWACIAMKSYSQFKKWVTA